MFFLKHVNTHTHTHTLRNRKEILHRKLHCSGFDCSQSLLQGPGKLGFEDRQLWMEHSGCVVCGCTLVLRGEAGRERTARRHGAGAPPERNPIYQPPLRTTAPSHSAALGHSRCHPRWQAVRITWVFSFRAWWWAAFRAAGQPGRQGCPGSVH